MGIYENTAHPIPKPDTYRLRGTVFARPLRLAFIVNENLPLNEFSKLLEYCCHFWGGSNNAFFPTNGKRLDSYWLENLRTYNSDIIFLCGKGKFTISRGLERELTEQFDAYSIIHWKDWNREYIKRSKEGLANEEGISVMELLWHQHEKSRPIQEGKSRAAIFACSDRSRLYPLLVAQFGNFLDVFGDAFIDIFKAKRIQVSNNASIHEYLSCLKDFGSKYTPLDLTQKSLRRSETPMFYDRPKGLDIFIVGGRPTKDISLFWNARLAPHFFGNRNNKALLILASDLKEKGSVQQFFDEIAADPYWNAMQINLYSLSVSRKKMNEFQLSLAEGTKRKVNIVSKFPPIAPFTLSCGERGIEVTVTDQKFSFQPIEPKLGEIRKGKWVNDLELRDELSRKFSFPDSSRLNYLLCGSVDKTLLWNGFWIRQTPKGLSFRVSEGTNFSYGELVDPVEAYASLFMDKKLVARPSSSHSYGLGFKGLLKSAGGVKLLQDKGIRDVFWYYCHKDDALKIERLKTLLNMGGEADKTIDKLLKSNILVRGSEFVCGNCGLRQWHSINEIREEMRCIGCLEEIYLPLYASFSYKLNHLALQAVKLGMLPVLILEKLLSSLSLDKPFSIFGLEVESPAMSKEITEFDLIARHSAGLILAECKELKTNVEKKKFQELRGQLKRQIGIAKQLESHAFIFGTFGSDSLFKIAKILLQLGKTAKIPINLVRLDTGKVIDLVDPNIEYGLDISSIFRRYKTK